MIAADLIRRGYKIAIPYGEDWDFDLIVCRNERLERVQCEYTRSDGAVIIVRPRSHSLTNGKVRATMYYTAAMIEWLAVYDITTECCLLRPGDRTERRHECDVASAHASAEQPTSPDTASSRVPRDLMEPAGFEPAAFRMQTERSTN
jgi:hypothetical protein